MAGARLCHTCFSGGRRTFRSNRCVLGAGRHVVANAAHRTAGYKEVAAARLRGQTGVKLFTDDVVQHFVGPEDVANIRESRPFVEYATRFIDDEVLKHVTMEQTPAQKLLYRQVVLVGDASDTRAYRLPWPTGTCIYHVASKEGHEWAEGAAKAAGLHVKRGCLLKRVAVDLAGSESGWCDKLISAGLQPDKVAVFAIQGLTEIGITAHAIDAMLGELTMGAALHSVVVGEFPLSLDEAQDVLACHGLLGWPFGFDSEELEAMGGGEVDWGAGDLGRVLFKAENQRPSLYQKDVVDRFRSEFEDLDEDFQDNFS